MVCFYFEKKNVYACYTHYKHVIRVYSVILEAYRCSFAVNVVLAFCATFTRHCTSSTRSTKFLNVEATTETTPVLAHYLPVSWAIRWTSGRTTGPVCSFSRRRLNATRAAQSRLSERRLLIRRRPVCWMWHQPGLCG